MKEKKLTKKDKQLLTGLHQIYHAPGDTTAIVGDDAKTAIKDEGVMRVFSVQTAGLQKKFAEEAHALAKKLGVKVEIKTIVKLI
jgi:hypothetical protein